MGERGSVFFIASKSFWMLASPVNLLLFGALAGVLLAMARAPASDALSRWLRSLSCWRVQRFPCVGS